MKMKKKVLGAVAVLAGLLPVGARDLVVKVPARAGEYDSIAKALAAAEPGDTVVLSGGTYHEPIALTKANGDKPVTIKAAPGARVTVSGFESVTGWKEAGNGVYTAHVDSDLDGLYIGARELACARWPADGARRPILSLDAEKRTFETEPANDPKLAALAKDPKSATCFTYLAHANGFGTSQIESYDAQSGRVTFSEKAWPRYIKPGANTCAFWNHPAFVTEPETWAFVRDADAAKGGTVWFKPAKKADLQNITTRVMGRALVRVTGKNPISGYVIDGLELVGSSDAGVRLSGENLTIRNCLIHHNNGGINVRGAKNVTIASNVVVANGGNGVNLASIDGALVEGNEIAYNKADGLVIAGNISGRPGANPVTRHVTARRNYIHHHYLLTHPDNVQMYRDVADVTIEDNVILWGGQSLMAEEAEDIVVRGNVVMGCSAIMLICGHGNSNRWSFDRNTLWGANLGYFSFTGKDYTVTSNFFVGGSMPYGESKANVKSRANRFAPAYEGRTMKPWRTYKDLAKAQAELGQEAESLAGPVALPNMPHLMRCGAANGSSVTSIALQAKRHGPDDFAVGDRIELNADGVLRTVTDYRDGILSFTPALPSVPFRGVMAVNWKKAKSTVVDTVPVDGRGASVSPKAFAAGDLLGKGRRTIPAIPADVSAALPHPNNPVFNARGN